MPSAVLRADARTLPLPSGSVDLIVTSPPYFGLRSYTDGGEHYAGQIGSEATPAEFLAALLACTREWMRVLKPSGSLFVNLGDKYAGGGGFAPDAPSNQGKPRRNLAGRQPTPGIPAKSLLGLPWRYALACMDDLGLILRAEIIWAKPNGLPESVTDRVRRSHEQVFHFTRQPRYYSAVDEIREPHAEGWRSTGRPENRGTKSVNGGANQGFGLSGVTPREYNPLGKLPGSVWEIPSAPLTVPARLGVDHFAAYPPELCRRIILGWSPPGICTACGEGRRPVAQVGKTFAPRPGLVTALTSAHGADGREGARPSSLATITGYACACPDTTAPTRPAVVLDPFGGTGTTALVASVLGRTGLSADLSHDYCRLAAWRTTDSAERARALGVPKPPPVLDGQEALFG